MLPVFLAPLLGGTAGRPFTLLIAGLCGLVAIFIGAHEWRRRRSVPASWFALFLSLALAFTLLQLIPLPAGLRAALAPGSDEALRQITAPLQGYPARAHPLSLDPAATADEALRLLSYLVLLLALSAAYSRRGEGPRLQRAAALVGGLIALLGALAALSIPLPPLVAVPVGIGTRARLPAAFINSNHMAGLLALSAVMTASVLTAVRDPRRPRPIDLAWLALLLLLNVALVGTLSRGGIAAGLCGQVAVLLWPRGQRSAEEGAPRRSGWLVLGAALPLLGVGLALALLGEAQRDLQARLSDVRMANLLTPGSKVQAWHESLPMLRGHLWLGVGRGAFGDAFQRYNSIAGSTRFPYLENQWLQPFLDLGVPAALVLLAVLLLGLFAAARRLRSDWRDGSFAPHRVGAFVALCALGLHNLVDFNLEVGGVALPVLLLCAAATRGRVRVPAPLLTVAGALVLVGSALVWPLARSAAEEEARLRALAQDANTPPAQVVAAGQKAVLRHPFAAALSDTVAERLWWARSPEALDWANRALLANPSDIAALRTAALVLWGVQRRGQAALMLRHAIPQANGPQRQVLYQTALSLARTPAELAAMLPAAPQVADEILNQLGTMPTVRWPYLRGLAQWADGLRAPTAPMWLARAALASADPAEALRQGERLARSGDAPLLLSDIVNLLLAKVEPASLAAERLQQAEALVQRALQRGAAPELLLAQAAVRERRGDLAGARQALEQALGLSATGAIRAVVLEVTAAMEERHGNIHRAAQQRSEAARARDE